MLVRSPELKVSIYRQTIITLLTLSAVVLLVIYFNQHSITQIGAGFILQPDLVSILIITCMSLLGLLQLFKPGKSILAKLRAQYHRVLYIMPYTSQEYKVGLLLSFVAGFTEEIIYRGFLFEQVHLYLPYLPSVILINVVFALCHWGTGLKNAFWSFVLGVIWSISYWVTDSLWLAIMVHTMVDLLSLTFGYKVLQSHHHPTTG